MKRTFCFLYFALFPFLAFSASVDYPKLHRSVQEELSCLWLSYALYESGFLKEINSFEKWEEYQECMERFDALFESATMDKEAKPLIGYLVYGNRLEAIERILDNADEVQRIPSFPSKQFKVTLKKITDDNEKCSDLFNRYKQSIEASQQA
ncbi:MAG: hypothetical protein K940chlam6_00065 [Chlamydiae bacterium]|nr:hypothetical protein [Chlamydiota bacterium]